MCQIRHAKRTSPDSSACLTGHKLGTELDINKTELNVPVIKAEEIQPCIQAKENHAHRGSLTITNQ